MDIDVSDDIALEQAAKRGFGFDFEVSKVIVSSIGVGGSTKASVVLTKKKQLLCYVYGPARLTLGDVKKILSRMGLVADTFLPPKGQPSYFDDIAHAKYKEVFPGMRAVRDEDLIYYRTLAPYCPALALISEVKNGIIYCADPDAHTGWRPATRLTYRRIKTS